MMKTLLILIATACGLSAEISSDVVDKDKTLTKIAFGSCNNPSRKKATRIYDGILKHHPDVFVFLGDNIYGDTEDMELLKKRYQKLGASEGYQKLQKQVQVLATWDDHDYGVNDGAKDYPMREQSQQVFLDFFGDPTDSVRRARPGIHTSYSFGKDGKKVQIILLDTRYFRDKLPRAKGKPPKGRVGWYVPTKDTSMTLLGDGQWQWLEEQLQVKADVRIIASSIQMLAYEKGMENWGNVPHEQHRLFEMLKKHKANHTVVISGDVHYTELSKVMIGDYPLYDMTSSGMTHCSKGWANADNSFRVGKSHWEINAGLIEIDWAKKSLSLCSINQDGKKLIEHPVAFSELEFGE